MRENRQSGSEGGGAEGLFLPLCAPESARSQSGESPVRAYVLRPVIEHNCSWPRGQGGEQWEMNDQSVG